MHNAKRVRTGEAVDDLRRDRQRFADRERSRRALDPLRERLPSSSGMTR